MVRYESLLSRSGSVSDVGLERRRVQLGEAHERLQRQGSDDREYDLSSWQTGRDLEWVKAGVWKGFAVSWSVVRSSSRLTERSK